MDIKKIQRDIEHQSRNGREIIYMSTSDLQELGIKTEPNKDFMFVNLHELNKAVAVYESSHTSFKDKLKVDSPVQRISTPVKSVNIDRER